VSLYRNSLEGDCGNLISMFKRLSTNYSKYYEFFFDEATTSSSSIMMTSTTEEGQQLRSYCIFMRLLKNEFKAVNESKPDAFKTLTDHPMGSLQHSENEEERLELLAQKMNFLVEVKDLITSLENLVKRRILPLLKDFMPKGDKGRRPTFLAQQDTLRKMEQLVTGKMIPRLENLSQKPAFKTCIRTILQKYNDYIKMQNEDSNLQQMVLSKSKEAEAAAEEERRAKASSSLFYELSDDHHNDNNEISRMPRTRGVFMACDLYSVVSQSVS